MSHIDLGLLVLLVAAAAGFIPWVRRWSRGRNLLTPLALVGLVLWSSIPVSRVLALSLEARYAQRAIPDADADAIVVLSGGLFPSQSTRPFPLPEISTYRRARFGAWLYHNWRQVPVIVSGGPIGGPPENAVVSTAMREVMRGAGVPDDRIIEEDRSLNTYQNARYSMEILRQRGIRRIALVTDMRHMLRAELTFRKAGADVVPAPCCAISEHIFISWLDLFPSYNGIDENEATLHEWAGLAWYWVRGRI